MAKSLLTKIIFASGLGLLTFLEVKDIQQPTENYNLQNKNQPVTSSVMYVEETKPQTMEESIADSKYSEMNLDELTKIINEYEIK